MNNNIYVCIGTPNANFDSIGPRVGSKLKDLGYEVYGTMENPIHGTNVRTIWDEKIKYMDKDRIIGIDAALSLKPNSIGTAILRKRGVKPRAAIDSSNNDIEIGRRSIVGIIGHDLKTIDRDIDAEELASKIVNIIEFIEKENICLG